MKVGWHYLEDSDPLPALGAAAFLDVAGVGKGIQSPLRLCRLYFKGMPTVEDLLPRVYTCRGFGAAIQVGNEPNNPVEGFGSLGDYVDLFYNLGFQVPTARLYWAAPSPGIPGWEDWYRAADNASGLTVHAYGTGQEMIDTVAKVITLYPNKPLWVSECNFGPGVGRVVDLDTWAREHLKPFLDWCETQPTVEAVSYFAYKWPNPDIPMGTPVDGVGTGVERLLRSYTYTQGGNSEMTEAEQDAGIDRNNTQIGLITRALIALREGRFEGAEGVDGMIVALNGGQVPDNYAPVFPPKA